jgi:hypothetical protein
MNIDNYRQLARALIDVCSWSIDEIGITPQEAVAAVCACMSFVVAQVPKEHDATIREFLKSTVREIVDLAAKAREIDAAVLQ